MPVSDGVIRIASLCLAITTLCAGASSTNLSLLPNSGAPGDWQVIVVSGTTAHFAQGVTTISFGPGITTGPVVVNGPTQLEVPVDVDAATSLGSQAVTVTTGGEILGGSFLVVAPPRALSSIYPNAGAPGATNLHVTLQGASTKWRNGTTLVSFGPGISVGGAAEGQAGPVSVTSATTAVATITINAQGALAAQPVVVTTGGEVEAVPNGFTVMTCSGTPLTLMSDASAPIPPNGVIRLVASAPLDRQTINDSFAQLQALGSNIPAKITLDASGRVASITPETVLPAGAPLAVAYGLSGTDACGAAPSSWKLYLTTGVQFETGTPRFILAGMRNGDTNVPLTARVSLRFDQAMSAETAPAGIAVTSASGTVPGNFSSSPDETQLFFKPSSNLSPNTTYTVTYTEALQSAAGVGLANHGSFQFTTGAAAEPYPVTTRLTPPTGLSNVGTNARIAATNSAEIDRTTVDANSLVLTDLNTGLAVRGAIAVSADGLTITLRTYSTLSPNHSFSLSAATTLTTLSGAALYPGSSQFSTGAGPVTAPPAVTGLAPPNGSAGVPTNADFHVQFSAPVDAGSVKPSSFTLTPHGGPPVQGVFVGLDSTGTHLDAALPCCAALLANTQYSIALSGLTDLEGHTLAPLNTTFTTGSSAAAWGQLQLVSSSPSYGAVNVPRNASLSLTFNEPLDPTQTPNVTLSDGFTVLPGIWAISGTVATFTPSVAYPSDSSIMITGSFQDLAGFNSFAIYSITTEVYSGMPPFTLSGVSPANNAQGVPPAAPLVLQFSEPLSRPGASGIHVFVGDQLQTNYSSALSTDGKTLTIQPGASAGSIVTVTGSAVQTDIYGTPLTPFLTRYTTGQSAQPQTIDITQSRPAVYSHDVSPNAHIFLLLSESGIDEASVSAGVTLIANGVVLERQVLFPDPQMIEIVPAAPLPAGATVSVLLPAQDTLGNSLNYGTAPFTVQSDPRSTAPSAINSNPQPGASAPQNTVAEIEFDQPILASSVSSQSVGVTSSCTSQPVAATVSVSLSQPNVIRIVPASPWPIGCNYQVAVNSSTTRVTNPAGLAAIPFTTHFGVTSPVTSITTRYVGSVPDDQSSGVGTSAVMTVWFDYPIDPTSVNAGTVTLANETGKVALSYSFGPNSQTLVITPQQLLQPNAAYTLRCSGLLDMAGNTIATGTIQFRTGLGPDVASPQLLYSTPAFNELLDTNSVLSLQFDKPMAVATFPLPLLSALNVNNGDIAPAAGNWVMSGDKKTATFTPATPWPVNGTIELVTYGLQDESGVGLTSPPGSLEFNARVGFGTGSNGPRIMGETPQAGASGLPLNVSIQVQFTEPVAETSLQDVSLKIGSQVMPSSFSLLGNGSLLAIVPPAVLLPNTTYTVYVRSVTNLEGVALPSPYTFRFTTGNGTQAGGTVVAKNPSAQPPYFGSRSQVAISFSEPVNALSVTSANFQVTVDASIVVPGTISVSPDGLTISFKPSVNWQAGTAYSVNLGAIQNPVYDLAGNPFPDSWWTFTTPDVLSAGGEGVSSVSPADKSVNVPQNAQVQIAFAQPLNPTAASASTIQLVAPDGTLVAGRTSLNGNVLTFTQNTGSTLNLNTQYTVRVKGGQNEAGVPSPPFATTFTTSASSSLPGPGAFTLVSAAPANGSVAVTDKTPIVLEFSEPIDAATAAAAFSVYEAAPNYGLIGGTWSVQGSTATFRASNPFPPNVTVEVDIRGVPPVTDLAGNPAPWSVATTFQTGAGSDTTPFRVLSVTPGNSAVAGRDSNIVIRFSNAINFRSLPSSLVYADDTPVQASITEGSDGQTIVIAPNGGLPAGAIVAVFAGSQIQDLLGNSLQPFRSSFTVPSQTVDTAPAVTAMRPATGATEVPPQVPVTLFVAGSPLNGATVSAAVHVFQNGAPVTGTVRLSGTNTIEFTPAAPFEGGTTVEVMVDQTLTDVNGFALASQYAGQFAIVTAPAVTGPSPVLFSFLSQLDAVPSNALLHVKYDQQLDPSTITRNSISFVDCQGQAVAASVSLVGAGQNILQIVPAQELTAACAYQLGTTGQPPIKNLNGLPAGSWGPESLMGGPHDDTIPAASALSPSSAYGKVGVNAVVTVQFTKPIDPTSVTPSTLGLSAGAPIPSSFSFDPANQTMFLTPENPLPANTTITASVNGVTDSEGHSANAAKQQFATGPGLDLIPPSILSIGPSFSGGVLPLNTKSLTARFNKAMNPLSANQQTFSVQGPLGLLPGTYSGNVDLTAITFTPAVPFTAGEQIYVYLGGITDLAGNALGSGPNFEIFTVSSQTDSTPLTVTAVSPPSAAQNVPLNVIPQVKFSALIDLATVSNVKLLQGGVEIPITVLPAFDGSVISLQPATLLDPNLFYTISVAGVADVAGKVLAAPQSVGFTTGAAPWAPNIVSETLVTPNPTTGASADTVIQISFSLPMDPVTLAAGFSLTNTSNNRQVPVTFSLSADGLVGTWTPATPLTSGAAYLIQLNSATDLAGDSVLFDQYITVQ